MSWDPLLCRTDLDLEAEFHPLGFPFTMRSNSRLALDAACRSFGCFPNRFPAPRIELRLIVPDRGPASLPPPPVFRAQDSLLAIVSDAANFATCDLKHGFAFCWVEPAVAADADFLRFYFLEAIAYTLLVQLCVTPVHASCIARNDTGILLCGDAGAGKSSLAYACARNGWTLVSDNACYLLEGAARPAVAGRPQSAHFRPSAAELFPELEGARRAAHWNGKIALDFAAARAPAISTAFDCPVEFLVFLARHEGAEARLSPVPADLACERLIGELPRFRDEVEQRHRQSILRLRQTGVHHLQYDRLEGAIRELERLVNGK